MVSPLLSPSALMDFSSTPSPFVQALPATGCPLLKYYMMDDKKEQEEETRPIKTENNCLMFRHTSLGHIRGLGEMEVG